MARQTLVCLLLREGALITVRIHEDDILGELKNAIKRQAPSIPAEAHELQLFLAKGEGGGWLGDETDLAGQLLGGEVPESIQTLVIGGEQILPTKTVKHWLKMNHLPKPSSDQIHVLVFFEPTQSATTEPERPEVNVRMCDGLYAFLEDEMFDKKATMSSPHILRENSLQFHLVGREPAMVTASRCFMDIIELANSAANDRTTAEMPVCAGISGLGKTRMLEEGGTILRDVMKLNPAHVASVIVPYSNGYNPQAIETSMPIEASFSWRLLYRFLLDNNCKYDFPDWFELRLPRNGAQLKFAVAVRLIERKLRQALQDEELRYLFIGINEYQNIESIGAQRKIQEVPLLHELVGVVGSLLCKQLPRMVVLPMFAGTDWGVIESGSIANSSYYYTERLPMTLLTMDEVFSILENNASYGAFLGHSQICRNLFLLGGVPRWIVDYLNKVMKAWIRRGKDGSVDLDTITKCFKDILKKYIASYRRELGQERLIRLAAFAVSGRLVQPDGVFDGDLKWSRLEDSSLCLLNPRTDADSSHDVYVPYALLHSLRSIPDSSSAADTYFAASLKDLDLRVNSKLFDLQKWQLWEIFGACFYAIRINALLVLGRSTVTLGELLSGTLMSDATRNISVKLIPTRVFRSAEAFGPSTPQHISRQGNEREKIDWTASGCIVVNGDSGRDLDIFFSLEDARSGKPVVFVDQRKRHFGKFQPSQAKAYLEKLETVLPGFMVGSGARLVCGVMNSVAESNLNAFDLPPDCFLLSRSESHQFHGALAYHPACSPVVSINSACKTALRTVLHGTKKHVDQVIEEICAKRKEPDGGFASSKELSDRIESKRLKVVIDKQLAEFSV